MSDAKRAQRRAVERYVDQLRAGFGVDLFRVQVPAAMLVRDVLAEIGWPDAEIDRLLRLDQVEDTTATASSSS